MVICENAILGKHAKIAIIQKKRKNLMAQNVFFCEKMIRRYHSFTFLLGKSLLPKITDNQGIIHIFIAKT